MENEGVRSAGQHQHWHDLPDRTGDPRIRRALRHRLVIALFKRVTRGRTYEFLRVTSINRKLFRAYLSFTTRLVPRGVLARRDAETLILRTAFLCGSRYLWTQHDALARGEGLSAEEIRAIAEDPESAVLGERQRLLLRMVPELLNEHCVSMETYDALSRELEPDELLEAVMVVGSYALGAGALNTFGVPLEPIWSTPDPR